MARPPLATASRITNNAFLVLGLTPRANWPRVKEVAESLLAALYAEDPEVSHYETPWGPRARTTRAVHRAMAALRDPDERIHHEIWWEAPTRGPWSATRPEPVWPRADAAWGWSSR